MIRVMTVDEVAKMLRVSKALVYKQASHGEIPSFKIGERVLFNAEQIEALVTGKGKDHEEQRQNNSSHSVYGTIRTRRIARARLVGLSRAGGTINIDCSNDNHMDKRGRAK